MIPLGPIRLRPSRRREDEVAVPGTQGVMYTRVLYVGKYALGGHRICYVISCDSMVHYMSSDDWSMERIKKRGI